MIRLYGRISGVNDSWARVTFGMRGALEQLGLLASFCPTYESVADLDGGMDPGYDAPVGVYIGPPAHCSIMLGRGDHRHRLTLIAANSTWLPGATMRTMGDFVTGLIGPSKWSCDVIKSHVEELPVFLWRHGIDVGFQLADRYAPPDHMFTALHMASSHKQRKGTYELIRAWAMAIQKGWLTPRAPEMSGASAVLRLVVDGPRGYWRDAIDKACADFGLSDSCFWLDSRLNLTVRETCELYQLHHVVVQPSRGEGFGLVPLEARASGVPVVATVCTGHAEHTEADAPGVIVVPAGPNAPVDDGTDGEAPFLDVLDVAIALKRACERWDHLALAADGNASRVQREWSWAAVTEKFVDEHAMLLR